MGRGSTRSHCCCRFGEGKIMKIKQHVVITRPDAFLKANYYACFALYGSAENLPSEWIVCGEIEIEVEVDSDAVVTLVTKTIEDEIVEMKRKHHGKLGLLERRLAELKALPAPAVPDQDNESQAELDAVENAVHNQVEHKHCGGEM